VKHDANNPATFSNVAGRASSAFVIGASVALTLLACSAVPDLHFDDDGGGTLEGGAEGGIDPNCDATGPEICDDGIDNDCNGRTDCQDARCTSTGFSCEQAPDGWTLVTFSESQHPPCPGNEDFTDLKVALGDSSPTCACTCMGNGGSCDSDVTLSVSADPTCVGGGATTMQVASGIATCTALDNSITIPNGARANITLPNTPSSCSGNAEVAGGLTDGRMCRAQRFGAGCDTGEVCALRTTIGLTSCVTKDGKSACPTGYTKRNTAGTSADDSRSCDNCNCGAPTPCNGGTVSLYSNGACSKGGSGSAAEGIDTSCTQPKDDNCTAPFYKSTSPSGGCGDAAFPGSPHGDISFQDERTICCR
jgi:hypothetical protein